MQRMSSPPRRCGMGGASPVGGLTAVQEVIEVPGPQPAPRARKVPRRSTTRLPVFGRKVC